MTQEIEDVVGLIRAAFDGDSVPQKNIALRKASDRIDVLEAGAELLFERLEHLRDTSGTETRLERGNRAAYHSALEIARATLKARAALHQEGIGP